MTHSEKSSVKKDDCFQKLIVGRYGEVHLKGANRGFFLRALCKNIESKIGRAVQIEHSRLIVRFDESELEDISSAATAMAQTFGIVSVSPAVVVGRGENAILDYLKTVCLQGSFKVEVNRADKTFPHKSPDFARIAGAVLLDVSSEASVDVINPKTVVSIDIREKETYIYTEVIKGVGGMPVGTAGRALVLLSGGIDSPVAAWLAAKRGLSVDCIHFASPPYTNEFALEKVRSLVAKIETYCGKIKLFIVPFTETLEAIRKNCRNEYIITIMRRIMIAIAEKVAISSRGDCIVTGENLAQVASQTVQSIASNNVIAKVLPIFRPLITYDKTEIIEIAKRIDCYKISCIPHPDCCTVFVPPHPCIKPCLNKIEIDEQKLDIDGLIARAIDGIRVV